MARRGGGILSREYDGPAGRQPERIGLCIRMHVRAAVQCLLREPHPAVTRVGGEPEPVPGARPQRCAGGKRERAAGPGQARRRALRAGGENHRARGVLVREHGAGCAGGGGPDQHGPGAGAVAGRRALDDAAGAEADRLAAALERGIEHRGEIVEAHAGAGRIRIGADHTHEAGAITAAVAHADMGREALAGAVGEPVEIAGDGEFGVGPHAALCARDGAGS